MFLFFNFLYWTSALAATLFLRGMNRRGLVQKVDNHALYPGQVQREIGNSLVSILIFSLQGIIIQQGLDKGWLYLSDDINWYAVPQMIGLFFWNEIHFYLVHRLLHTAWLRKRVHWVHHHSKEPTVYSTFSFHWIEAFLLGTVIIFPMAVFPLQVPALLFLPVMSIVLNTLGHCNYEFFPNSAVNRFFSFSNRHSMHHKKGRGNYGFMLNWFDGIFQTRITKSEQP